MTTPALVKEADIMRVGRAAKKLGMRATITTKDGTTIVFDMEPPDNHMLPYRQPDPSEPLVHIRKRPTKKVTL